MLNMKNVDQKNDDGSHLCTCILQTGVVTMHANVADDR